MTVRMRLLMIQGLLALDLASAEQDSCLVTYPLPSSGNCDCLGSLLRVEWFGRLGNNLLQLAHVLHLAQETQAEVIVPHADFLSRHSWDFRGNNQQKCQIAITDNFFFSKVCPDLLDRTVFPAAAKRKILQTHVLPVFQIPLKHSRDTVVVHVRGGDIFTSTPPSPYKSYTQPPLIFYNTVLQLPEVVGRQIVLCTEDFSNPVVNLLQEQYQERLQVVTDLAEGISIILGARHLVFGQSSFSEMLSLMSPDLQSMYVPFCVGRENLYTDLRQQGWGLPGYCFEYTNYISINGWEGTSEQLQLMTNLTSDNIQGYALHLEPSSTEVAT